jgi:dihydroflavonol-4-reductase
VAAGHALALERGVPGERYVLGGENLPMREVLRVLSELTGIPAPRLALPHALVALAGRIDEWIAAHAPRRSPTITREAGLHARDSRPFDSAKARRELGFAPRPARAVLLDAVRWFATEEYCPGATAERVARRLDELAAGL